MITIFDLLEDEDYKAFFIKNVKLPPHLLNGKRWRLWVQLKRNRQWKKKDFASYADAFKYFRASRDHILDAAIGCPGYEFKPPSKVVRVKGKYHVGNDGVRRQVTKLVTWKPKLPLGEEEAHNWCPYCRRPTVFRQFSKHHALLASHTGGVGIDNRLLRCTICGASENIVNLRKK